ncbi:MAG: hypothetical protein QXD13_01445 [Candidatus Pacearchaeota archaeon]
MVSGANIEERIFYKGIQLIGTETVSPLEQLKRLENYEDLLRQGKYNEVEELEQRQSDGRRCLDLNIVIYHLINEALRKKDIKQAKSLINRFKDRGYSEAWIK